jgi:phage-related minor tail protein
MADEMSSEVETGASALSTSLEVATLRTRDLELGAGSLARAMTSAFSSAVGGAKQLDDVLKSLALRLSDLSVRLALQPLAKSVVSSFNGLFAGFTGSGLGGTSLAAAMGAIKPFAAGGVIGTPTYFPLASGGVGLAGEAGPEAIVPLARGSDGRLGISAQGGGAANITISIATPDAASFRRSEAYLTGQIARAVARGQRGL